MFIRLATGYGVCGMIVVVPVVCETCAFLLYKMCFFFIDLVLNILISSNFFYKSQTITMYKSKIMKQ